MRITASIRRSHGGMRASRSTSRRVRIRTAVDEQPPAARSLDEDRVALADVEDGHARGGGRAADHDRAGDGPRLTSEPEVARPARRIRETTAAPGRRSVAQRSAGAGRWLPDAAVASGVWRTGAHHGPRDHRRDGREGGRPGESSGGERHAGERQLGRRLDDPDDEPQARPSRAAARTVADRPAAPPASTARRRPARRAPAAIAGATSGTTSEVDQPARGPPAARTRRG